MNGIFWTVLFVVLTLVVTVFGCRHQKHRIAYSNTAVTLGVLGTFVGLLVGLMGFDVHDISRSIPVLLEGLKTAFITSVVGMICGLLLRVVDWWPSRKENTQEVRAETTLEYLQALDMKSVVESTKAALASIQRGICGEDTDSSLLNQMKLMRQTLTDEMKELNASFKQFTERQANDNTKAIMEALERVLSEFKVAIEENLSQSFREFSEACKHLYEWQSEHKGEIEQVHSALNESIQVMKGNESLLARLTESQQSLVGTTGKLDAQLDELRAHTEALESLRKEWPVVLLEMQKDVRGMIKEVHASAEETAIKSSETLEKTSRILSDAVNYVVSRLKETTDSTSEILKNASQTMLGTIESIVSGTTERVSEQMHRMDEGFSNRLEQALGQLFEPLASISDKIAKDYLSIKRTIGSERE